MGLRNLIAATIGFSKTGTIKPIQRLWHCIALIIQWSAVLIAYINKSWIPLISGFILAFLFRRTINWSNNYKKNDNNLDDVNNS